MSMKWYVILKHVPLYSEKIKTHIFAIGSLKLHLSYVPGTDTGTPPLSIIPVPEC